MSRRPTGLNVYEAAKARLRTVYRSFSRVYLSVSFGKDSSLMLHLALEVAEELGRLPVHILFVDLEGQYQSTIAHAQEMFARPSVTGHWVCLPLNLRNAVSAYQPFWTCWDPTEQDRWIRPLPDDPHVVTDPSVLPFFQPHMEFEAFVPAYGEWFSRGKPTACCVGIRTAESLNRFRTIASQTKSRFDGLAWTTRVATRTGAPLYNAYPIYDWTTEDVWTAFGKKSWPYNRIYDLMHLAGVSIHQARICQPYGDDQRRGLDLFHRCEPETWHRVVARVTGANFGARYAKTALLGFRRMEKPPGHTWKSYAAFLLDTLPKYEQEWYRQKFARFFGWYATRGTPFENILDAADPDQEAAHTAPSWRRICRVLLTNDKLCKSLSFSQTTRQWEKYTALREEFGE